MFNYFSYTMNGDTSINGETYHRIYMPYRQEVLTGGGCCVNYFRNPGYCGAIRQEIINKKVWYVNPDSTTEQLLYNFNAGIGDTVSFRTNSNLWCNNFQDTILSIDSILIGTNYRKRWHLLGSESIIEGIGSTRGLLETGCEYVNFAMGLNCFSQDGVTLFPNSTTTCNVILSMNDLSENSISFSLFPNPFHAMSRVNLNSEFQTTEIRIYNALGLLIRDEKIHRQIFYNLNRYELPNGIYFIQLINDKGQVANQKFIVE